LSRKVLIGLGFALVYLYCFPFFGDLKSANELPRVLLTEQIVDHGTFRLDGRLHELGSRFDVATTPDGHSFSNKAPGVSFLAVPAYLVLKAGHAVFGGKVTIAEATWAFRVSAVGIPSLLFLWVFFGLARRFAPAGAPASLVAYGLGSMALPYGILFFSHQLSAVCAGAAFCLAVGLVHDRRGPGTAVAVGLLAGASVLVDYQSAIAALAIGVYLLVGSPRRLRDAGLALAGTIPPAVLLGIYHRACFGSPLKTGYSFAADPAHKQGVLGIIGPNLQAMGQALIAPDNGLLFLTPWVLLGIVGFVALWRARRWRAEAITCAVIVLGYILFVGSLVPEFGRAGWSVGPRYICVALPFAGWLAAAGLGALDGKPAFRAAAHTLVLYAAIVFVVATTTYPHWPIGFQNPLHEVSLRLLGDGLAPHSLGTLVGLRGLPSLLPLYLTAAGLAVGLLAGRDKGRLVTTGIAALAAGLLVFSTARLPTKPQPDKWRFIKSQWEPRPK
jgi:hypothetical protein